MGRIYVSAPHERAYNITQEVVESGETDERQRITLEPIPAR